MPNFSNALSIPSIFLYPRRHLFDTPPPTFQFGDRTQHLRLKRRHESPCAKPRKRHKRSNPSAQDISPSSKSTSVTPPSGLCSPSVESNQTFESNILGRELPLPFEKCCKRFIQELMVHWVAEKTPALDDPGPEELCSSPSDVEYTELPSSQLLEEINLCD